MGCGATRQVNESTIIHVRPQKRPEKSKSLIRLEGLRDARSKEDSEEMNMAQAVDYDIKLRTPRSKRSQSPGTPQRRVTHVMSEFRRQVNGFSETIEYPLLSETRLRRLFQLIDADNSGTLDFKEIQLFWQKMGWASSVGSIQAMFKTADANESGSIDWNEFAKFFRSLSSIDDLTILDPDDDAVWVHPKDRRAQNLDSSSRLDSSTLSSSGTGRLPKRAVDPASRMIKNYEVSYLTGFSARVKHVVADTARPFFLATCKTDSYCTLFDSRGQPQRTFRKHNEPIVAMCLSSDSKHLATVTHEGIACIWNAISGVITEQIVSGLLTAMSFGNQDTVVYGGSSYGIVSKLVLGRAFVNDDSDTVGQGAVLSIRVATDVICCTLSRESSVFLLHKDTLHTLRVVKSHGSTVWHVALSHDNREGMSICDCFVKVWNVRSLRLSRVFPCTRLGASSKGPSKWITGTFLSQALGQHICVSCSDMSLYVFNLPNNCLVLQVQTPSLVYAVACMHHRDQIVAGDDAGNLIVVELY
ncbi:hypothetical protein DIPPA_31343 [Diplonema papillatum]|nr:hypothetical protein DIPPA_31343 [Diplonema papillatum]